MPKTDTSQSGNVLFIILIAVALFAALSYAVTSSSRSGGTDTSYETAITDAATIKNYVTAIRTAITRITASGLCDVTELSFEAPPFDGTDTDYVNPNSPSDFSCHIFHPDGGYVSYKEPNPEWLAGNTLARWQNQFIYTGADCVPDVGLGASNSCWNNGTTEDTELLMFIFDINDTLCSELNDGQPIATMADGVGGVWNQSEANGKFKGVFGQTTNLPNSGHIVTSNTDGRFSGCFFEETPSVNAFFAVLVAR